MKLESSTLPIEMNSLQKTRKYRVTLRDRLELLKSKFMEKFVWGPEIPNAETARGIKEAWAQRNNPEFWSPRFTSANEALAWLKTKE